MTDREKLLAALDSVRWQLLRELADEARDRGDDATADGWLWLAESRKSPAWIFHGVGDLRPDWYVGGDGSPHWLPSDAYGLIPGATAPRRERLPWQQSEATAFEADGVAVGAWLHGQRAHAADDGGIASAIRDDLIRVRREMVEKMWRQMRRDSGREMIRRTDGRIL